MAYRPVLYPLPAFRDFRGQNLAVSMNGMNLRLLERQKMVAILESYSKFATNTCIIIDPATENLLKSRARVISLDVPEMSHKISIRELQELIDA